MDPILAALVAGATLTASEVGGEALKDAYQGLKRVLTDTYKLVSTSLLEKDPSSKSFQKAVEEELAKNPAIGEDRKVLEKAKAVQDAASQVSPEKIAGLGIDIKELEAAGNIIAKRIEGGVKGDKWKSGKDVVFEDVKGGGGSSGRC